MEQREKRVRLSIKEWFVFVVIGSMILGSFVISRVKVSAIKSKINFNFPAKNINLKKT